MGNTSRLNFLNKNPEFSSVLALQTHHAETEASRRRLLQFSEGNVASLKWTHTFLLFGPLLFTLSHQSDVKALEVYLKCSQEEKRWVSWQIFFLLNIVKTISVRKHQKQITLGKYKKWMGGNEASFKWVLPVPWTVWCVQTLLMFAHWCWWRGRGWCGGPRWLWPLPHDLQNPTLVWLENYPRDNNKVN